MSKGSQARLSYAFAHLFFVAWLNQFAVRKFYKIGSSSHETKCLEKEARSRTHVQIVGQMQVRSLFFRIQGEFKHTECLLTP